MKSPSLRVNRKVKIGSKWILCRVPLDKQGRPDGKHVFYKDELVEVTGGTFYIAHGHGKDREQISCGSDPEAVRRAMRTQAHVLELRALGMEVADAPEIVENRRRGSLTLRAIAQEFVADPPPGLGKKSRAKYRNALESFAEWAAGTQVHLAEDVNKKTVARWIRAMQADELDASTIVPKVNIVLAQLEERGFKITLDDNTLPTITEREREIYTDAELRAIFHACDRAEFELYQTFLLTGMRYQEVAFLAWSDVDASRRTIRVTRKRDLGFEPKTYEERTIPIPQRLVELLQERGERLASDGAGLIFATSREFFSSKRKGGRADRKMLNKLKQIARRAGLNCGHCIGSFKGEEVSCRTYPCCKRWGLHKFRHTYATSMLRDKVDIVTVSKWLGHKDLATTRIYLKALNAEMAQPQVESSTLTRAFAGITPDHDRKAKKAPKTNVGRGKRASAPSS